MSFEQNYGNHFQPYDENYDEENDLSNDEILQLKIDEHLAFEEWELEEIKDNYRRLCNEE